MKLKEKSDFSKNLIAIRKAKGLSQRDLAKLSGISDRMIAYYENYVKIPNIENLDKIAKALDVSITELLDEQASNKEVIKLDTRTLKKVKLLEQLSPADQRKVVDYIKALMAQEKISNPS